MRGLRVALLLLTLGAARSPGTATWSYEARVAGIPVTDRDGSLVDAPFLGGFDVPRPQLFDVDGDGKPELFLQEQPGEMMMFARSGATWSWRTNHFQNIDVGEWYRLVREVPSGRALLFGEMKTGYIRLWRDEGPKGAPNFVAVGDTIRDVDGRAIVADRQNILTAADIDCNGRLDLFIGRVQGVVDRFEQDGVSPGGAPRFRLIEENWQGIEVVGPEAAGGMVRIDTNAVGGPSIRESDAVSRLHGANTLAFADVYGRGVLDLFWGDFFEQGLLRFENTGTCAQPNLTGKPIRFPSEKALLTSGYNAPTFGDVTGDGLADLLMGVIGGAYGPSRTSVDNLYFAEQAPKGVWNVTTRRAIPTIDVGSDAAPTLGDLNGDGLLDLVVGGRVSPTDVKTGTVTWFENVGTAAAPSFRERGALGVRGAFSYAPAVVDLDGDGLNDLVFGNWTDRLLWYRNTGTARAPAFVLADTALVTITRGSNTVPSFGDLDGDGLVDLLIGKASGHIIYYRNTGSRSAPKFSLVSDQLQGIRVGRRSAPTLVDINSDGRLDLLIGAEDGHLELWLAVGNAATHEVRFERDPSFVVQSHHNAIPAAAVLRVGAHPDLLVGTSSGGVRWFTDSRP